MLMTEYDPKSKRAQKRVKLFIPSKSNDIKSTKPNDAQNSDCDVSKRLECKKNDCNEAKNAFEMNYHLLGKSSPNGACFFVFFKIRYS